MVCRVILSVLLQLWFVCFYLSMMFLLLCLTVFLNNIWYNYSVVYHLFSLVHSAARTLLQLASPCFCLIHYNTPLWTMPVLAPHQCTQNKLIVKSSRPIKHHFFQQRTTCQIPEVWDRDEERMKGGGRTENRDEEREQKTLHTTSTTLHIVHVLLP